MVAAWSRCKCRSGAPGSCPSSPHYCHGLWPPEVSGGGGKAAKVPSGDIWGGTQQHSKNCVSWHALGMRSGWRGRARALRCSEASGDLNLPWRLIMFLGSKRDNHSVLKLDCGNGCITINLLKLTGIIHKQWVNFMVCKLHLNKANLKITELNLHWRENQQRRD